MSAREPQALRVAHVMSSIAEEAAGPSYTVPALCDALARAGTHTELHVLDAGPPSRYAGASYVLYRHQRVAALRRIDSSSAMKKTLSARAGQLDLFHAHGLWRMPGLYAARAARSAGRPYVVTPRGMLEAAALEFSPNQKRIFWTLGQGRALLQASCLHATSDAERESMRKLGLRNPIAVVQNGVHMAPLERLPPNSGPRVLLYLGRLHPIKALDRLLDAWAPLERKHPEWSLRIVGPDAAGHRAQLEAQSHQLGLQRISFGEAAFGADKQREFDAAQLYVLPSHSENFGMTVAEALARGVPVLASRGAPWSGLQDHACGLWMDNSVAALRDGLERLISQPPAELQSMGMRGRAWMERSFSWASKAEQVSEMYRWLLLAGQKRPGFVETMNGDSARGNWRLGARRPPW